MTIKSKQILSLGLVAATFLAVLPFFAGSVLLLQPSFAQLVARIRRVSGAGPVSFVPLVSISALVLAIGAFVLSWKARMVFMVSALVTTGFLAVIALPGSILGAIVGLGIFWALSCKSIRRTRASVVTALNR